MKKKAVKEQEEEIIEGLNEDEAVEEQNVEVPQEENEIDKMKKELEESNNKFLRLNAEFQNFKRRTEKEKADIFKFANGKLFGELLGIMDNMERALDHIEDETSIEHVVEGLQMIKKSFDEVFEKNAVKAIEAVGAAFDPEMHHAVMSEESEDHDADVVIQELQKGYTINDKVIRPSMVKVSK